MLINLEFLSENISSGSFISKCKSIIAHILIFFGLVTPWQSLHLSLHQFYWVRFFKLVYLCNYLIFCLSSRYKTLAFNFMIFFLALYPICLILNPSWYSFIQNEIDMIEFLKSFLGSSIFESNFKQIKILNVYSFIGYGYFLTFLGTFIFFCKENFNLSIFIRMLSLVICVLCLIYFFIYLSIHYLEKNNMLGRKIFLILNTLNNGIDIISSKTDFYLEVGNFDSFNGIASPESQLFLVYLYGSNGRFSNAIYELKNLKYRISKPIFDNISFILAKEIVLSSTSINQKILFLKQLYSANSSIEIRIILGILYYKNSDYKNSLVILTDILKKIKNRYLLADMYNLLGDIYSYFYVAKAREYYKKSILSYDRVKSGNFHAFKGLAGW